MSIVTAHTHVHTCTHAHMHVCTLGYNQHLVTTNPLHFTYLHDIDVNITASSLRKLIFDDSVISKTLYSTSLLSCDLIILKKCLEKIALMTFELHKYMHIDFLLDPFKPQLYYIRTGSRGVNFTRRCFHDVRR